MKDINIILFDYFTILDAFGPVEVFQRLETHYRIKFYSENGGKIKTKPDLGIETVNMNEIEHYDILLIPGGQGTRELVNDGAFITKIREIAVKSENVLTVCTGSALLAKTGLLSGHRATTNKMAFQWVASQDGSVAWQRQARWVVDGKYYTSSGITAGIDMALGFVEDTISTESADKICSALEYVWNKNRDNDPFGI
jgi:transcriptional regulator GlxA family with amidase domain